MHSSANEPEPRVFNPINHSRCYQPRHRLPTSARVGKVLPAFAQRILFPVDGARGQLVAKRRAERLDRDDSKLRLFSEELHLRPVDCVYLQTTVSSVLVVHSRQVEWRHSTALASLPSDNSSGSECMSISIRSRELAVLGFIAALPVGQAVADTKAAVQMENVVCQ